MQHILPMKSFFIVLLTIHLLVLAGCGKSSQRLKESEDRDRQTQEQILRKARGDYENGKDAQVINDLNRFLSTHAKSSREKEARWLLAQSYERSGKLRAALKQYTIISKDLPPGKEQKEVTTRIDEVNQRLKKASSPTEPIKVVRTSLNRLSLVGNRRALKELAEEGVTSVLIDFGCPGKVRYPPQTAVKTSDGSPHNQLPSTISQIHRNGLLALVGINLRCLGYPESRMKKQWLDGRYYSEFQKVKLSPYFDIFHPQYQSLMASEIKGLTDSGIDGVVFLADAPLGIYDGFTPGSVAMFNKTFHTRMNPYTLFKNGSSRGDSPYASERQLQANSFSSEDEVFWRWAGWKARQRLTVLQDLMDQVHEHQPGLRFGLELHPESVEDPLGALTRFSEDFLEANQKGFSFFLITPRTVRKFQSESRSPHSIDLEEFLNQSRLLLDRMTLVVQNPARIWLSIPWGKEIPRNIVSNSAKTSHLQKVSQIYDLEIFLDN